MEREQCDVAIVGAGPVGLLLACLLSQRGVDVQVLEQREALSSSSRAIGIHPPGLQCLREVGLADALIESGVRVRRGRVLCNGKTLGAVAFQTLAPPFDFVLSVPQTETERLLAARLRLLSAEALQRGVQVVGLDPQGSGWQLSLHEKSGQRQLSARFVVGCDGKQSIVRRAMDVGYRGGPYRQSFVMGDFADETGFGAEAAVYFTRDGLVESFPLPGRYRRWVLGTRRQRVEPSAGTLAALIERRTQQCVAADSARMLSGFTAEHYRAASFVRRGLVLAGDAAHVLSPIGGQGMNLGWLDARMLADTLKLSLHDETAAPRLLAEYASKRQRAAALATRRAELFMALGCASGLLGLRAGLVRALLSRAVAPTAAQLFTMRGLVT